MLPYITIRFSGLALHLLFAVAHGQTLAQWARLNSTLSGRLKNARPVAAPCYDQPEGEQCTTIRTQLASGNSETLRANEYPGFINIQGEACISQPGDQCLLDEVTLHPLPNATCRQGLVSRRYVEVSGFRDVQAIFKFAKSTGISLSIKNSGHDYVMRSSSRGSLAIWTRGLSDVSYYDDFIPDGCHDDRPPNKAFTFGAGLSTLEALQFAREQGMYFGAPLSPSIGASGGWLLNGGHSILSGTYGLAVDRVLEFTIVTPDGNVRKVNDCTDPELFWSLRGGGGGSFGVVLDSTYRTETSTAVTSIIMSFSGTSNAKKEFLNVLAKNAPTWALAGWGGGLGSTFAAFANPSMNLRDAEVMLSPAIEFVRSQNGSVTAQIYADFYDYWSEVLNGLFAEPAPISSATFASDWIVPESIFQNSTSRSNLIDTILETEQQGSQVAVLMSTPFLYGRDHLNPGTSIHPAWYESVWIVGATVSWPANSSLDRIQSSAAILHDATERWSFVAPDGCSYSNEADPWIEDWSTKFWGDNYNRLMENKRRIDPHNLLHCWRCVGWDEMRLENECISGLITNK